MLSAFDATLMDAEFQSDFQFIGKFRPLLSHGRCVFNAQKIQMEEQDCSEKKGLQKVTSN